CVKVSGLVTVADMLAVPIVMVPDELVVTFGVIVLPEVAPVTVGAKLEFTPALNALVFEKPPPMLQTSERVTVVPFGTVSEFVKMKFASTPVTGDGSVDHWLEPIAWLLRTVVPL